MASRVCNDKKPSEAHNPRVPLQELIDARLKEIKPKGKSGLTPMDFGIVAHLTNPIDELAWIRVRPDLTGAQKRKWIQNFYANPDGYGIIRGLCFCKEDKEPYKVFAGYGALHRYCRIHKEATGIDMRKFVDALDIIVRCMTCGHKVMCTKDFVNEPAFSGAVAALSVSWIRAMNQFITLGSIAQQALVESAYELSTPVPVKEDKRIDDEDRNDNMPVDKRLAQGESGRELLLEFEAARDLYRQAFLKQNN